MSNGSRSKTRSMQTHRVGYNNGYPANRVTTVCHACPCPGPCGRMPIHSHILPFSATYAIRQPCWHCAATVIGYRQHSANEMQNINKYPLYLGLQHSIISPAGSTANNLFAQRTFFFASIELESTGAQWQYTRSMLHVAISVRLRCSIHKGPFKLWFWKLHRFMKM